ncbi:helix-turn-helix domain-containing protein [Flavobacterium cerinum]|uniref:AraC family transcriptional regulator n=1 Tax=Flavobacterium cerinum TaxID=2502784 RepID=A0ABY5IN09_9FLAO|nr:helix-turn-helix domain-containing protein [Flavobacterium cerinum]UUC44235.1 AraC family transcriptional regulator [Flavobacterium cerinum]
MKQMVSENGHYLIGLEQNKTGLLSDPIQFPEYAVLLIHKGKGTYHADFSSFGFSGPMLLFATPMQTIYLQSETPVTYTLLRFHTDFYCIETHREEVACNGLLFNTIYIEPSVTISETEHTALYQLIEQMKEELERKDRSEMVIRAYLQLLLAKCSSMKLRSLNDKELNLPKDAIMEKFRLLLDEHYLTLHKPNDYADLLAVSPNTLSKKAVRYFGKTPSQLIQERLILEAKKMLHLTSYSIKEIAYRLQFNDEYYFSRFFKKHTQVSPLVFRNESGRTTTVNLSIQ